MSELTAERASEKTSQVPCLFYADIKSEEFIPWEIHADRDCPRASIGFRSGLENVQRREAPVMALALALVLEDYETEDYALLRICKCVQGVLA